MELTVLNVLVETENYIDLSRIIMSDYVDGLVFEWVVERLTERVIGLLSEWVSERVRKWMNGWVSEWASEWASQRMKW